MRPDTACAARARAAVLLGALLGTASDCPAQYAAPKAEVRTQEVIISATRITDEQLTRQVQETLAEDPWIFADHITVTARGGVIRLEGIVGDTGELFRVLRLCRKIPGARRVVNELEMMHNDPDGG
jgi:osmotically-inducible protein OsmY